MDPKLQTKGKQHIFSKLGVLGISMRLRLFLFLVVLVLTMLVGIIFILFVTGTFTAGLKESQKLIENQLLSTSFDISKWYGQLSVQAVEFSEAVTENIENELSERNIGTANLKEHPEILEELLSNEYELTLFSLQKSNSSGAFIILDATINTSLENSEHSKAGLYIKNMEPNIINFTTPTFTILRGFPSISRNNSLSLRAQWSMEFDISDAPYFSLPIEAANSHNDFSLSRLYYWSEPLLLPKTSEEVMLCSVPLIDSDGNVFGVCGFDISSMLFKLSHMPDNSTYNRMFCMLSPISGDFISIQKSMFAGGYSARNTSMENDSLKISMNRYSANTYNQDNKILFLGLHTPIQLYPSDSTFSSKKWICAIMVPKEDIVDSITHLNLLLSVCLSLLVLLGVIISFILSRKYLNPISRGIEIIKSSELKEAPKTNVLEIDDLIHFLSLYKEEVHQKAEHKIQQLSVLEQFVQNSKTLSPAESSVFNLYVQGFNAKEISDKLFLSINTIKTHSKRIYVKLNVTTREELLLYVNMLKEIGQDYK